MKKQSSFFRTAIRKAGRISLSILLTASMTLGGIPTVGTEAAQAICETYSGTNVESQNYSRWSSPITSYLTAQGDGTFMRVQYGSKIEGLLVEYYDAEYNITSSKIVAEELPIFGGFYATDSNYFVVTGQENTEESDTKEVYRITKYDKNWNKISSAGLSACNTTVPFDAGSCRMDACGSYLLIRTSHEMYATDGVNHQANVTIELNMDTMTITDSYTSIMNNNLGYVSHSFNQFIKIENNKIVAVDHGDASPRAIAVLNYQTDVSTGKFVPDYFKNPCSVTNVLEFPGTKGQNTTGASVGGFEISGSGYLIAGNSVVQDDNNLTRSTRNVFVAAVDKTTSAVSIHWLTSYEEGDGTTSTPQMVKVSDDKYIILWSRDKKVYYTFVNGSGVQSGSVYSMDGNLSDCVPVVSDGKLVWYTWNENIITFYDIDLNDLSNNNVTEIINGHHYEILSVADGTATLKCTVCQTEEQISVATSMNVWWNDNGGNSYSSYFTPTRQIGDKLYCWIVPSLSGVNTEMEVISSDSSVASVEMEGNTNAIITMNDVGTATITVRPKYNPDYYKTYKITVEGPLKLNSFTADQVSPVTYGESVNLCASAAGGNGTLQYKFYEELSDGTTRVIRDYSSAATCQWSPDTAGVRTLYVDVKDGEGTVITSSISNYTVNKAAAPTISGIAKHYCYAVGASDQSIDLKELLPADCGLVSYSSTITDRNGILENVSVSDIGILSYDVKNTGAVGNTAAIKVTVVSDNYETMGISVEISLTDKKSVEPKEGYGPELTGSNLLTYGQTISSLTLNKAAAVFVADSGKIVSGTLNFENPDLIPTVGTTSAGWVFIPDSEEYSSCSGEVSIEVNKATPDVVVPLTNEVIYAPDMLLNNIALNGGSATAVIGGASKQIAGNWSWKVPEQTVQAGSQKYVAVFIPSDSTNYNSVEANVDVTISKATPMITTLPSAEEITYGDSLENSLLIGGTAKVGTTVIEGTYNWSDASVKPAVADSQSTQYDVMFTPSDSINYNTVSCKVALTVQPKDKAPNMPGDSINVSNSIMKVSQVELPEGWSWLEDDADKDLFVGENILATAVYEDRENYTISSIEISIFRSECEHVESDLITDVPATCIETGIAHIQCIVCGAILRDNIELPLIEHDYGNWECKNEEVHIGTCSVCGAVIEENHSWDGGTIIEQPTTTEEGIKTFTCIKCGAEKTETIEKLKSSASTDVGTSASEETPKTSVVTNSNPSVQTGVSYTQNGMKYKVTVSGISGQAEVTLVSVNSNKKSITVPNEVTINGVKCKVTAISAKAFANNKTITKVTIGKNVKSIGKKAFYKCKKLKKIIVKSKVLKTVGKKAIKGIHKKAVIKVPKKKLKAYKKLFVKKSGLVKTMKIKK